MRAGLLLVFGMLAASATAQVSITPRFSGRALAQVGQVPTDVRVTTDAGGEASFEDWGLRARLLGGVAVGEGKASWDLPEATVSWQGESWGLDAGWWPEPRGPALFHSLVPVFASPPASEFLSSAGDPSPRSPGKLSARLAGDQWSLTAEVSPWQPIAEAPDPGSTWFPRKDIPTSYGNLFTGTYTLRQVLMAASEVPMDPAYRVQARWSALWGEAVIGGFGGQDDSLAFPYLVTEPAFERFDITLRPLRNRVTALWASLEVPWGPLKLWTEHRVTLGRLRADGGLEAIPEGLFRQTVSSTDVYEAVGGLSASISGGTWGTLRAWAEGNLYHDLVDTDRPTPDFSEGTEGGLHWDSSQEIFSVDLMAGSPWDRYQGWVWAKVTWNWMEGRTLWMGVPWFWGSPDTVWGQYGDRKVLAVGSSWGQ